MLLKYTSYKKYTFTVFILLLSIVANAQTTKETALQKCRDAIKLEDEGRYDEALNLLAEAKKLDPDNTVYKYEESYVWYMQKQYQKVIDSLVVLKDKPDSFDRLYQLLGNSYDILKQGPKAIAIYDEGIKKFPKSGPLYLERGVIPLDDKKYEEALPFFEQGIAVDPAFPSNYYWAAKIYCNSTESIWGMLYGELFMNLERNSSRTAEISKLLYDTYKSQITFPSPGKAAVSFSKNALIDPGKPGKLPYSAVYEPAMGIAVITETGIDINSLDRIRQNFLKFYFDKGFNTKYPNVLLDYQNKITQAGCMEAYNHWLLMKGEEDTFNTWKAQNPAKWEDFIKWYSANPLKLSDESKFYRTQY